MSIKSKNPIVVKEIVRDAIEGDYTSYFIHSDTRVIEELTLKDIIFIRDKLSEFIEMDNEKGGKS